MDELDFGKITGFTTLHGESSRAGALISTLHGSGEHPSGGIRDNPPMRAVTPWTLCALLVVASPGPAAAQPQFSFDWPAIAIAAGRPTGAAAGREAPDPGASGSVRGPRASSSLRDRARRRDRRRRGGRARRAGAAGLGPRRPAQRQRPGARGLPGDVRRRGRRDHDARRHAGAPRLRRAAGPAAPGPRPHRALSLGREWQRLSAARAATAGPRPSSTRSTSGRLLQTDYAALAARARSASSRRCAPARCTSPRRAGPTCASASARGW